MERLESWTAEYNPRDSLDILRELARAHALKGGLVGRELVQLIHDGSYEAICAYKLNFSAHWDLGELRHCAQAIAFFKKLEELDLGFDLRERARQSFSATETRNRETNEVLRLSREGKACLYPRVDHIFLDVQRKIAQVLGPVPTFRDLGLRFGKGATTRTKKRDASRREKLAAGVSCSPDLFPYAKALLEEMYPFAEVNSSFSYDDGESGWCQVPVAIEHGILNLVPKNANSLRIAVTEPVLNGMYQMALGDHIRWRLQRFGVDLTDQSVNKQAACDASLNGLDATVDLKDASNMIAYELPFELLPLDWAHALARGRTSQVDWNGELIPLQLFSSMGNGYTFPLQSLIYWAIARAVSPDPSRVKVYGDDLVVGVEAYDALCDALSALGMVVNRDKSYYVGPFRESCGGDFYLGVDVRPFFQKKWVSPRTLFALHNYYIRVGLDDFASRVVPLLHPRFQIFGPDGYGDGHLLATNPIILRKKGHVARGFSGRTFRTLRMRPMKDDRREQSQDYAYALYMISRRAPLPLVHLKPAHVFNSRSYAGLNVFRHRPKGGFPGSVSVSETGSCSLNGLAVDDLPRDTDEYEEISIYTLG